MVLPVPWCRAIEALGETMVMAPGVHPETITANPAVAATRENLESMIKNPRYQGSKIMHRKLMEWKKRGESQDYATKRDSS
ncbi:hypothetical protein [Halomonas sp. Y3]|uniref:hypothetical protein n=1 Tax=Halomonas sp. Y3 TaxID=2956797 RepID=UPI00209EA437|nr:hypothetical protein [Halomonas sp. Y3]